jgi:hypothetical protein
MVANLFRKTNYSSWAFSFVWVFLTVFFLQMAPSILEEEFFPKSIAAFGKSILILLILAGLMYFRTKNRYLNVSPFILLSTPLTLLFFPKSSIQYDGLLITVLIVIVFLNLTTLERTKKVVKPLFNTSLCVSICAFFDPVFYMFFLPLLFSFFSNKTAPLKTVVAIGTPFLIVSFLNRTLELVWGVDLTFFLGVNKDVSYGLALGEFIGFYGFCILVFALLFFSKKNLRKFGLSPVWTFIFLLFVAGFIVSFLDNQRLINPYEIIFFPMVYLIGLAFEERTDNQINAFVFLLFIVKVGLMSYTF